MTALKAHEVARFLARPNLTEGVCLAYGPDGGLVRETAQRLCAALAGGATAEVIVFDGGELDADPARLAMEARTGSLFGERRVLRVRGAGKALVVALADLVADPQGAAIVLESGNLPPRDPLRALIEAGKFGWALPCYPDSDETLQRLIAQGFSEAGVIADPDVVPTLRDLLGNDREITRRELEKLVLFAADSKRLTCADVLALCADNAALVTDEIVDAAATGRAELLDSALTRALTLALNPQQLLSGAALHFMTLRRWRSEVEAGRSVREVLDNARPRPHFSRRAALEQQLRLWRDGTLAAALARLRAAAAESRRHPGLAEPLLRRTLLALSRVASEV
jgi:DNA polymerase III subunit delta